MDPCTLPKKTGNCKGYFLRYFYSPEDNSCKKFVFGGCSSNGNNFFSQKSCEATCTRALNVQDLRTSIPTRGSGRISESRGDASMVQFGEDSGTSSQVQGTTDKNLSVIQGKYKKRKQSSIQFSCNDSTLTSDQTVARKLPTFY